MDKDYIYIVWTLDLLVGILMITICTLSNRVNILNNSLLLHHPPYPAAICYRLSVSNHLWYIEILFGKFAWTQSTLTHIWIDTNSFAIFFAQFVTTVADTFVARWEPIIEIFTSGRISTAFLFFDQDKLYLYFCYISFNTC